MRVRYIPVSTSTALRRLRLYRLPSGKVVRYRSRGRSPNVNVIRTNSSPRRQIAKSTKVENKKKVTTNNIKQTIILAKTANIMSPVGGNQNNGPSAVVTKGAGARAPQQKPGSAGAPKSAHSASSGHSQQHGNPAAAVHHNINIHHRGGVHGGQGHGNDGAGQGHGHMAGPQGHGIGGHFGGHVGSNGIPVNFGGNGHGMGGVLGGHLAAAGNPGHSGGGNGHGAHGAHLNNNFMNHGNGNGNGLSNLLSGGFGNANGNGMSNLNALLGGISGFGNSNGGQNNGLGFGVQGQNGGQGHGQGLSQGHGNGNNQLSSMLANANALNILGGNGPEFTNPELMSQLLSANLLSGGSAQQSIGGPGFLNAHGQSSAGTSADMLLQSLLGGNVNLMNGLNNLNGMNGAPGISMAAASGLQGASASFGLNGMPSVLDNHFASLSPSLGVTQQPVVIKSNGGQLNIGLKKDPNTGKSNIVIQTAAAAMAQEMMEAEPGEMR